MVGWVCPHCGAGASPTWAAFCCFPCSILTLGEDHGQEGKGPVGGRLLGRAGLWDSKVVPGVVVFVCLFIYLFISWLFVNKHASKGLAGCWNWYQFWPWCIQPISVFSRSAHAIAAKEIMLSQDSDLAVSNKRPDEEKLLRDLFSPGKLSIVYSSAHGIWLPVHGNTESSP